MNLTSTKTWAHKITHTDLTNMWTTATVSDPGKTDLSDEFLELLVGSTVTDPGAPGRVWFDQKEQVLRCYHENLDSTTVSLWLKMGPDTWEDGFLAEEPIPPRALLEFSTLGDRWVKRHGTELYPARYVAVSALDATAESGTWLQGVVHGFCNLWAAERPTASTYSGLTADAIGALRFVCASDHTPGAIGTKSTGNGAPRPGTFCAWTLGYTKTAVDVGDTYPRAFFGGARQTE
jgi:hypothetical protein